VASDGFATLAGGDIIQGELYSILWGETSHTPHASGGPAGLGTAAWQRLALTIVARAPSSLHEALIRSRHCTQHTILASGMGNQECAGAHML
jgi:hypothetical protein